MSVSVVSRPTGHKIIDQAVAGTVIDVAGVVGINKTAHALNNGDVVYIISDIEDYNGFVEVLVADPDNFLILRDGVGVPFYQAIAISYYQTLSHYWNAIFLPIVYKLLTDKWPTNTADTAPTAISSSSDDNGYTRIELGATLRSVSVRAFEFIQLTGGDVDGVYQIIEKHSSTSYTINLSYQDVSGVLAQYYYNNYQVLINIYGGLNASHPWATKKPYELLATLSITPDSDNIAMFSVSDILKSKIKIENNLLLNSLPLNLDAFTQFKIEIAEAYDYSDGYAVYRLETPFVADSFEGYASDAMLPFKNVYSGMMSDYVYASGLLAKWLTYMTDLLGVEGYFFDLSVILNDISGDITLQIDKYVSDYLTSQESIIIPYQGIGVYRIPITMNAQYDRFCVRLGAEVGGSPGIPGWTPAAIPAISTWTNVDTGNKPWTNPLDDTLYLDYNTGTTGVEISDQAKTVYAFEVGKTYTFRFRLTNTSAMSGQQYTVAIFDIGGTVIANINALVTGSPQDVSITRTATSSDYAIGCYFATAVTDLVPFLITLVEVFNDTPSEPDIPPVPGVFTEITEDICIDIIAPCDVNEPTPTEDTFRITEDDFFRTTEADDFRILET